MQHRLVTCCFSIYKKISLLPKHYSASFTFPPPKNNMFLSFPHIRQMLFRITYNNHSYLEATVVTCSVFPSFITLITTLLCVEYPPCLHTPYQVPVNWQYYNINAHIGPHRSNQKHFINKHLLISIHRQTKTSSWRNRDVQRPQFEVAHVAARERSRNLWRSKQNRCTCIWCGHCNIYMIIFKMAYDCVCCTQGGTHQWESTKKIQVKHNLGRRLYGGHGENKIGGAL